MKTYCPSKNQIIRQWHLIDVEGKILGRVATKIAQLLQGKHKPYYVPHLDCGDYVVVINAGKVKVSGKKEKTKVYFRHSNYPGGFKQISFEQQMKKDPRKIIFWAVKNMLPKNKLRDRRLQRLKIFSDSNHFYQDKFQPQKLEKKSVSQKTSQKKDKKLAKKTKNKNKKNKTKK